MIALFASRFLWLPVVLHACLEPLANSQPNDQKKKCNANWEKRIEKVKVPQRKSQQVSKESKIIVVMHQI